MEKCHIYPQAGRGQTPQVCARACFLKEGERCNCQGLGPFTQMRLPVSVDRVVSDL